MSMSSSLFRQKDHDLSSDIDDLRQQNRMLYEENVTLKRSLEELININTELTESIEEFNNSHTENFPHINQQEIEQLAHRVIELEQQLQSQRSERIKERAQASANDQHNTIEQTLKVIQELVNSFRVMQEEYQQELQRIEKELQSQKNQWLQMSESVQQKMSRFEGEYNKIIKEMSKSEAIIKTLESEMHEKNKGLMMSKKEMKISTTIQDLRMTLQRQIEEKDRTIKVYEDLIDSIKMKLSQKIG